MAVTVEKLNYSNKVFCCTEYGSFYIYFDDNTLWNFKIFKEHRQQGKAKKLFRHAKRLAKVFGIKKLSWGVDNPEVNIPIYEKLGATLSKRPFKHAGSHHPGMFIKIT